MNRYTKRAKWWERQKLASKAIRRHPPALTPPKQAALSTTWEDVNSRSPTPCRDCQFHWRTRRIPCLRHTLPDERAARASAIGTVK